MDKYPKKFDPEVKFREIYYEYNEDEVNALIECGRESYWRRCLPLQVLFGGGTFAAINAGYLKSSKNSAILKVVAALVLSWFLGKLSYRKVCEEKLMKLNTPLGDMLREKRRRELEFRLGPKFGQGESLKPFQNVKPSERYSDIKDD